MRISDWSSDVCSSDLACRDAEAGEAAENNIGKGAEVADDEGEGPDIEHLLDELAQHILVVVHRPPERGQGHVDADQYGGKKGDIARQQPEPAVDVAYEGFEEAVDDVEVVVHGQSLCCALSVARLAVCCSVESLLLLPLRFPLLLLSFFL